MNILQKIQNQPEKNKKIILWATLIVLGLILAFFLVKNAREKIREFEAEKAIGDLDFSKLEIPELEIPNFDMFELEIPELEIPDFNMSELEKSEIEIYEE